MTWAAGRKAADARLTKTYQSSRAHRTYLLTGVLECACGRKLHDQTRAARGREWMCYLCRDCGRKSIPTKDADQAPRRDRHGDTQQLRELIGMLLEKIRLTDDGDYAIEPVPAAQPFFAAAENLLLAPPDALQGARSNATNPLAWYAIASSSMPTGAASLA